MLITVFTLGYQGKTTDFEKYSPCHRTTVALSSIREMGYFHQSHRKGHQAYGHQAVVVMLSCNGIVLHYVTVMYDKSKVKVKIVQEIASELSVPPVVFFFLCEAGIDKKSSTFYPIRLRNTGGRFALIVKGGAFYLFDISGRYTPPNFSSRYVMGYDCTCRYNRIITYCNIAYYDCTGTYSNMVSNNRLSILLKTDGDLLVDPTFFSD